METALAPLKVVATLALVWLMINEGLGVELRDLAGLRQRRWLLLRMFLTLDVFVPLVAWALVRSIQPDRRVAGALLLLAACPIAPLALRRIVKAGGARASATTVHLVLALLSIVTTPLTLHLLASALGFEAARIPPVSVARQVALVLLLPLGVGIAIRARWPAAAEALRRPGGRAAILLLGAALVLVLLRNARSLVDLGAREYGAMLAFCVANLMIGDRMGGKAPGERTVFALEAASRNLGLALFIASMQPHGRDALPILVPYVVVFALTSSLYLAFTRRGRPRPSG